MKKWQFVAIMAVIACVGMLWTKGWSKIRKEQQAEADKMVTTVEVPVGTFTQLDIQQALHVTFIQGTAVPAKVTTQQWMQQHVMFEPEGQTLHIRLDEGWRQWAGMNPEQPNIEIVLQAPTLTEAEVESASSLKFEGVFSVSGELSINLDGASSFTAGNVGGGELDLEMKGASSVKIDKFTGREFDAECEGASSVKIRELAVGVAKIEAGGASAVTVQSGTAESIEARATGASSVKASGLVAKTGTASATGASTMAVNIASPARLNSTTESRLTNKAGK